VTKIEESGSEYGSIGQRHGFSDPDPQKNVGNESATLVYSFVFFYLFFLFLFGPLLHFLPLPGDECLEGDLGESGGAEVPSLLLHQVLYADLLPLLVHPLLVLLQHEALGQGVLVLALFNLVQSPGSRQKKRGK
jgi:hypothetical protein